VILSLASARKSVCRRPAPSGGQERPCRTTGRPCARSCKTWPCSDSFSEDRDFSLLAPDPSFDLSRYTGSLEREVRAFGFDVTTVKGLPTTGPPRSRAVRARRVGVAGLVQGVLPGCGGPYGLRVKGGACARCHRLYEHDPRRTTRTRPALLLASWTPSVWSKERRTRAPAGWSQPRRR
jgi:hypothetical protein